MNTLFACGVTLVLALQSAPQNRFSEVKATVADKSVPDAPLRAIGDAAMTTEITSQGVESTEELSAILENISAKPILAFEIVIDLSSNYIGGSRHTHRSDYFFDDSPLMPGSKADIAAESGKQVVPWQEFFPPTTLEDIPTRPVHADVTVSFVQFSDGTTFATSQWSIELAAQRRDLISLMRGLLRAFDEDGEPGLESAIAKEQSKRPLPIERMSYLSQIEQTLREKGASATVQYLRDRLANAQRRLTMLARVQTQLPASMITGRVAQT